MELLAKVTYSVIPAKAVRLRRTEFLENPGFRVALRPVHHAVQGFACPE